MQPAGPSGLQYQVTHGMINDAALPPPVLRETYEFVRLVREYNNGELYGRLIQIFDQDYVEQSADMDGTVSRLEQLVENHSELREALKRLQVQVKVDNYILRIKDRLAMDGLIRYNEILEGFTSGQKSTTKMVEEIALLFANHMDLFAEFCELFPGGSNFIR
ncbi:hypothetical protein FH972_019051 [Carpinus fangiana]|uniref:Uncharacterized protein n=1 Tax=Carpinus fangiana TaxID=176857 RepID=A0A5N6RSG1_9ROSI|nr:hypothetical protein FH972_019051 [Carpinus fangiana]